MLARFCASTLLLLILSPFTAPFSTYDLGHVVGHRTRQGAPLDERGAPNAVAADASTSLVPAVPAAGRVRILALAALRAASMVAAPSTHAPRSAPARGTIAAPATLHAVLRL
jgi:hypothetical protein